MRRHGREERDVLRAYFGGVCQFVSGDSAPNFAWNQRNHHRNQATVVVVSGNFGPLAFSLELGIHKVEVYAL
jgi:hypothetical protein